MDILGGSFLCICGVFSKGQGTELGYCFGLLEFQVFLGVLEIPDIFGGAR